MNSRLDDYFALFKNKFPTSAHCTEKIAKLADGLGLLKCLRCGSNNNLERQFGVMYLVCRSCNKETHFFESTLFKGMKRPLAWYAAIYFSELGLLLTAHQLSTLASVNERSARLIVQKTRSVIEIHLPLNPQIKSTVVDKHLPPDLSQNALSVYGLISETSITFDTLMDQSKLKVTLLSSALFELEMGQLIENIPGNRFIRIEQQAYENDAESRKRFLVDLESYLQSRVHEPDWLSIACLKHGPIRDIDLKNARRH